MEPQVRFCTSADGTRIVHFTSTRSQSVEPTELTSF
jgi:hypothetical protein